MVSSDRCPAGQESNLQNESDFQNEILQITNVICVLSVTHLSARQIKNNTKKKHWHTNTSNEEAQWNGQSCMQV